ncbi:PREDICTED: uncharacterized protein LOC105155029 [Acromyrmex echinatior]|uniref:uncharacterized protein LOC105155029 n=1 Tax=Acromyrmex echinatior TaxID=103372 RepID=UPI000580F1D4|nr:PREDICTED: uncharacterized protein LOC105155029 [Acromyrmex echinatior]
MGPIEGEGMRATMLPASTRQATRIDRSQGTRYKFSDEKKIALYIAQQGHQGPFAITLVLRAGYTGIAYTFLYSEATCKRISRTRQVLISFISGIYIARGFHEVRTQNAMISERGKERKVGKKN